jgi:hypothetical protein
MDIFKQHDVALVEAASIAAESTSNASAAACTATTPGNGAERGTASPLLSQAAIDTQRILDTIKIAMSLTASQPRTRT